MREAGLQTKRLHLAKVKGQPVQSLFQIASDHAVDAKFHDQLEGASVQGVFFHSVAALFSCCLLSVAAAACCLVFLVATLATLCWRLLAGWLFHEWLLGGRLLILLLGRLLIRLLVGRLLTRKASFPCLHDVALFPCPHYVRQPGMGKSSSWWPASMTIMICKIFWCQGSSIHQPQTSPMCGCRSPSLTSGGPLG